MKVKVGGVLKDVASMQCKVGGVLKDVIDGYINKNGILYPLSMGTPIGELAVGSSVYVSSVEYIIVHQGLPSSLYDDSCDGTWLLRKNIYSAPSDGFDKDDSKYAESDVHANLNGEFLDEELPVKIQNVIKEVKIPYVPNPTSSLINSGSNGLTTKAFLLCPRELGSTRTDHPIDGACLNYFSGISSSGAEKKRIATYGGENFYWMLRSPYNKETKRVVSVTSGGAFGNLTVGSGSKYGIRPAFIVDEDAIVDSSNNIIGG